MVNETERAHKYKRLTPNMLSLRVESWVDLRPTTTSVQNDS